jgi:hypothetical protein
MGAWKKLNQQDVYVTSYTAKKSWSASSGSLDTYGIQVLQANSSSTATFYLSDENTYSGSDVGDGQYPSLVYRSLSQLYFKNHNTSSGLLEVSSSYENFLESSLATGSRALGNNAMVYSIPRSKYGNRVEPGTFRFGVESQFASGGYIPSGYTYESEKLYDDGEGIIRASSITGSQVGTIVYSHGQAIITEAEQEGFYRVNPQQDISWKSNVDIYTYNYTVRLPDYEYNFTQNPTALTGSDNSLRDNITGSYFQPYITTVGLYNDSNELIAVAKLSKPLPKSKNTETTIQIKLDI